MTTEQALIALLLNRVTELERQVDVDELTQVNNQNSLVRMWGKVAVVTVIAVDVKGLGQTNREQGHNKGDLLLQQIASELKLIVRRTDCVFRRGGDEFVLIIPCEEIEAESVEQRVRSLPYDLYVGMVSGNQVISDLVQAAFSQVEVQKNIKRSKECN